MLSMRRWKQHGSCFSLRCSLTQSEPLRVLLAAAQLGLDVKKMTESTDPKKRNSRAKTYGVLAVAAAVFIISFWSATVTSHAGAYTIAGFAFFAGMALAAVEILGLKVGGHHLHLERQMREVQEENKRLKEATEALLRSYYVLLDSVYRPFMGGPTVSQLRMVNESLAPVRDLFPPGLQEDALVKAAELAHQTEEEEAMNPLERQRAAGLIGVDATVDDE